MAKYRKKDLKHDEFKETIENIVIFYEHHKKTVLWIISGLVALFIFFFVYKNNRQTKMAESKEMYNMGVILYENGNFNQARDRFQAVVDKYWATPFVNRSTFMLANISYKEGNLDDAMGKFQSFIDRGYDELFTPSAYQGLGQCYEQRGNLPKAIDNYMIAADKFKDNFARAECLLNLSRLYLGQQEIDKAESVLEEIFNISEDVEILEKAEKKLKLVQVQKEFNE
jgi:TolA-binding protein